MFGLIPVAPRVVAPYAGLVLVDPGSESYRIGEYVGQVARISIIFEERCDWRLCIRPRFSDGLTTLLRSSDVKTNELEFELIEMLGHEIYVPETDVLVLETRGSMSRCITYLKPEFASKIEGLKEEIECLLVTERKSSVANAH